MPFLRLDHYIENVSDVLLPICKFCEFMYPSDGNAIYQWYVENCFDFSI